MTANGKAADDGLVQDLAAAVQGSLGGKFKDASISGSTLTFTRGDGTTKPITLPSGGSGASSTDLGFADAPNGTDDTATIEAASANRLRLRSGTYYYKGAGIDSSSPYLVGTGYSTVIVNQSTSGYVINSTQQWEVLNVEGVHFEQGSGAIRNTYTGSNVTRDFVVRNCIFQDYTVCAISHNAADMPYWRIESNEFRAASDTGTIAVALSGLTDQSTIRANRFLCQQIAIKLRAGFANIVIENNDFIHYNASSGQLRVRVWLVPKGTDWQGNVDAGSGTIIRGNKFGPENGALTDRNVLVATEGTGATNELQMPSLTAVGGYVNGVTLSQNNFGSTITGVQSVVETWTPNLVSSVLGPNEVTGETPTYFVYYAGTAPSQLQETTVGPITRQWNSDMNHSLLAANAGTDYLWVSTHNPSNRVELFPNTSTAIESTSSSGGTDSTLTSAQMSTILGA